jgi:hypothetical protein
MPTIAPTIEYPLEVTNQVIKPVILGRKIETLPHGGWNVIHQPLSIYRSILLLFRDSVLATNTVHYPTGEVVSKDKLSYQIFPKFRKGSLSTSLMIWCIPSAAKITRKASTGRR